VSEWMKTEFQLEVSSFIFSQNGGRYLSNTFSPCQQFSKLIYYSLLDILGKKKVGGA